MATFAYAVVPSGIAGTVEPLRNGASQHRICPSLRSPQKCESAATRRVNVPGGGDPLIGGLLLSFSQQLIVSSV